MKNQTTDVDVIAEEALKALNASKNDFSEERKELSKLKTQLSNCTKAISSGLDYPELREEITKVRLRIAELEQRIASVSNSNITVTKEDIVAKLKKDVENITSDDIPRLIKSYVTKIYAHNNEVIITVGVNMDGCGGAQHMVLTIPFVIERGRRKLRI